MTTLNPEELAKAPFILSTSEFESLLKIADELQKKHASFPNHSTVLNVEPDIHQILAEVIRAGAYVLDPNAT